MRKIVRFCDNPASSRACNQQATTYKVWREGEHQAYTVDLCNQHAKPLLSLLDGAELDDLPVKPRAKMEPTVLRSTKATKSLKRA